MEIKGVIYDLDGVIVNTARLHLEAWTMLAEELGVQMTDEIELALRGLDRMRSLDLLLK
ncbi:MAG: HAD hydrolase-like protein [Alicyclobacillus sp.]|nr:HAD hydrolase-like protein [Alicyclobacillus sp.]